ncbi:MAG TPA: hypothetical protein VN408_30700 [Actinoplanes sp.]|nr:hypothetical protein [Actinoplanes sp.]
MSGARLRHWADVDPSRWPFDPATVHAVVRAVAPPFPAHPATERAGRDWNTAMSLALAGHYGDWAYGWWQSPLDGDYHDAYVEGYDYWRGDLLPEDEHLAMVAESLTGRRDALERQARRYAEIAPMLVDAAGYEAVITKMLSGGGSDEDHHDWYGYAPDGVRWLLEATGHPPAQVSAAIDDVFAEQAVHQPRDEGPHPADIAERIAGRLCAPGEGPSRSGAADDDWPDTWPAQWPSWRATNRRIAFRDGPPGPGR